MRGNIGSMVMGIVMIVIALLMFGIVLDAVATLIEDYTLTNYTGLEQLVTISPLLIFIGLLAGGGWLTFKGFAGERAGRSSRRLR